MLKKHIDLGDFETYKMLRLLNEAKQKTEQLPDILIQFYDLYCKGYNFLQDLGLGIGLAVEVPRVNNTTADTWDELSIEQQKELLKTFRPNLKNVLNKLSIGLKQK